MVEMEHRRTWNILRKFSELSGQEMVVVTVQVVGSVIFQITFESRAFKVGT